MRDWRRRQAGFTLVDTMVALLITTLVAIALAGAFFVGYRTISGEARQITADQAVSGASLSLVRDLTSATTIATGTLTPGAGALSVTYGLPTTTATYKIDAANNLVRTAGATTVVVARGMLSLTVAANAPACHYSITLVPSAVGAAAVNLRTSQRVGSGGCL